MIFPVKFPEARQVLTEIVYDRAWIDNGPIDAEIWPLKKASNSNSDGFGLPYKNSHKIFTTGQLVSNMRIIDGEKKYLVSEPQDWSSHREAFLALIIMNDLVKIERQSASGVSPTGTPSIVPTTVFASMLCHIRPDDGEVVVVTAGETAIVKMKLFCDMATILEKDVVTDLNSGSKYKVINVKQHTQIAYTEVVMLGGVL